MKYMFFLLALAACTADDSNFRYVNMEDFKYEKADLKEQATIDILSFSGGKVCDGSTTYYYQFIGVDKSTGDTVRILTPCQTIKEDIKPTTGTFASWDNTEAIINDALISQGKTRFLPDKGVVVFNKHQSDLEERNYKTAIGTLSFAP